jgi:hypothetical protein
MKIEIECPPGLECDVTKSTLQYPAASSWAYGFAQKQLSIRIPVRSI